ncbi:MAG: hypothetical protein ABFE07_00460, partial [Armatimonadia bacterium]
MFRRVSLRCFLGGMIALAAGVGWAGTTTRIAMAMGGAEPNGDSLRSHITPDGRYVAFDSYASNLVPGDTNGQEDAFVYDSLTGRVTRVSVSTGGAQANDYCEQTSLSADGRYVVFYTSASTLVSGDTSGDWNVFLHDCLTGQTTRVGKGASSASLSADGRYVAFCSWASNVVAGDTNGYGDVFVYDRTAGTTRRVSVSTAGTQANGASTESVMSADGRYVAFISEASNLVAGDTNGKTDVFVRDLVNGLTTRVSVSTGGAQANGDCSELAISTDGRYVAFVSYALNLVAGDTNGWQDVFVRDRVNGQTTRASVATGGAQADGWSGQPSLSADGRYVAFMTYGSHLTANTSGNADVFVRDRETGQTTLASVAMGGVPADSASWSPSLSADGRHISFESGTSNLVPGDTNGHWDIFVRDTANVRPTPPTAVTIVPAAPGPEDLWGTATGATGGEGAGLTYKYQWSKKKADGTWDAWGRTGQKLAAANVMIGDTWRVRAQAFDGTLGSAWKIGSTVTIVSMAGVTPAPKTYNVPVTASVFASF